MRDARDSLRQLGWWYWGGVGDGRGDAVQVPFGYGWQWVEWVAAQGRLRVEVVRWQRAQMHPQATFLPSNARVVPHIVAFRQGGC